MKVDLSGPAVAARLKRCAQLRRLCLSLGRAGAAARDPLERLSSAGRGDLADTLNGIRKEEAGCEMNADVRRCAPRGTGPRRAAGR